MSNEPFEPDEEFWQGVHKQAEYYKRIFTDQELAAWADPGKCVADIEKLQEGKLLDRELKALSDDEGGTMGDNYC